MKLFSKVLTITTALAVAMLGFASSAPAQAAATKLVPSVNALAGAPASAVLNASKCINSNWCISVGRDSHWGALVATGNPTSWTVNDIKDLKNQVELSAVDCISSSWCVATGLGPGAPCGPNCGSSSGAFLVGNPATWTSKSAILIPDIYELTSVVCMSTTYCYAFGRSSAGAVFYQGDPTTWKSALVHQVAGVDRVWSVSCVDIGSCTALTAVENVSGTLTGDPTTWASDQVIQFADTDVFQGINLNALSCTSASFCVALANTSQGSYLVAGNPSNWSTSTGRIWAETDSHIAGQSNISCMDEHNCTIAGSAEQSVAQNHVVSPPILAQGDPQTISASDVRVLDAGVLGNRSVTSLSCASTTFCLTTFRYQWLQPTESGVREVPGYDTFMYAAGDVTSLSASSVKEISLTSAKYGADAGIQAFDCPTVNACVQISRTMVGKQMLVLVGDPTKWNLAHIRIFDASTSDDSQLSFTKLECASVTSCVGIGNFGLRSFIVTGNPLSWTSNSFKLIKARLWPNSLSCVSTTWCAVAGGDELGNLLTISGKPGDLAKKAPSLLKLPVSSFGTGAQWDSISCTSSTFCVAIGRDFNTDGQNRQPIVAYGDPAKWKASSVKELKIAKIQGSYASFSSISCISESYCAAVGLYNVSYGDAKPMILAGKPSDWSPAKVKTLTFKGVKIGGSNIVNNSNGALERVSCQKVGSCTVTGWQSYISQFVGTVDPASPSSFKYVLTENVPTIAKGGEIRGLACVGQKCFVTGTDNSANSFVAPY